MNKEQAGLDVLKNKGEGNSVTVFDEKIVVVADELLLILKDLSENNKEQINSKVIAEKMSKKDSIKKVFSYLEPDNVETKSNIDLKELVDSVFEKFSELVPCVVTEDFVELKEQISAEPTTEDLTNWLSAAVQIIKEFIDTTSLCNKELLDTLKETVKCLENIELQIMSELSSHHKKFQEHLDFEGSLSSNMSKIKQCIETSDDIDFIKKSVVNKINRINEGLKEKRKQDVLHLQKTELNIDKMRSRMKELKQESELIRKKSQDIEFENMHDSLTKVYNRKSYNEKVKETIANLERYNVSSVLLEFDVDHFKIVNDTYGHKVGDQVLKQVALIIKERLRKNDFIARYGGEEFVVILTHIHLKDAIKVGENIRSTIEKTKFLFQDGNFCLTVSGGVTAFRNGDDADTVFERADKALYVAKKSGRNMIKAEDDD